MKASIKTRELIKRYSAYSSGFTLVEILIAILVFMVIIGGGIANYRRLNNRKQVEDAAKQVEQIVRSTQKKASSGYKPSPSSNPTWCANSSADALESYHLELGISAPSNNYSIKAICNDATAIVEFGEISGNVVFDSNVLIVFDLLGRSDADHTVCIRDTESRFFYQIRVVEGGSVSFQKTNSC